MKNALGLVKKIFFDISEDGKYFKDLGDSPLLDHIWRKELLPTMHAKIIEIREKQKNNNQPLRETSSTFSI